MATSKELDTFLRNAQNRAFKTAMYACRDEQVSLEIVQDAMIKLCENYSDKPVGELPALFGRIVQNRIYDHFRKDKNLSKVNILYEDFTSDEQEGFDFAEALSSQSDQTQESPESLLSNTQTMKAIEEALHNLPDRQREAFILRHWEGLDTDETALAMGVSTGSVKTHLSRATSALANALKLKGIKL